MEKKKIKLGIIGTCPQCGTGTLRARLLEEGDPCDPIRLSCNNFDCQASWTPEVEED